jgi:hypothetical protein
MIFIGRGYFYILIKPLRAAWMRRLNQRPGIAKDTEMNGSPLNKSRLIVGIILVVIAVLMFVFLRDRYSTAGAIAIGILGLVSIAIARRK